MNNFRAQLQETKDADPRVRQIIQRFFPSATTIQICEDLELQAKGVDHIVTLSSGKILFIEEKIRTTSWQDVLLETVSVDATGAPGWIVKEGMLTDYLLYIFTGTRAYLYPWELLKIAWARNGEAWLKRYGTVKAVNKSYTTLSVPVPLTVLSKAIQVAAFVGLGDLP